MLKQSDFSKLSRRAMSLFKFAAVWDATRCKFLFAYGSPRFPALINLPCFENFQESWQIQKLQRPPSRDRRQLDGTQIDGSMSRLFYLSTEFYILYTHIHIYIYLAHTDYYHYFYFDNCVHFVRPRSRYRRLVILFTSLWAGPPSRARTHIQCILGVYNKSCCRVMNCSKQQINDFQ